MPPRKPSVALSLAALALVAASVLSLSAPACSGDLCEDLLVELQACPDFKKAPPPAGLACNDARGAYAECVLNSGLDLCKALVTGEATSAKQLADKCGSAPK